MSYFTPEVRNGKPSRLTTGLLVASILFLSGCNAAGRAFSQRVGENFIQTGVSTFSYNLVDNAMNRNQRRVQQQIPENVYWKDGGWYPIPGYAFVNPCVEGDFEVIKVEEWNEELLIKRYKKCF